MASFLFQFGGIVKPIAMVKAYVDESGTHQGSKVLVIAAYVGTCKVWEAVEGRFKRSDKYSGVPFHAVDCAQGGKDFKGMHKDRRYRITKKNIKIINDHDIFGIASVALIDDYASVVPRDGKHWETWLGDPFKGVFMTILDDLCEHVKERYPGERISVAMEDSPFWYPIASKLFLELKHSESTILGTIAPYSSEEAVQLYAPDLLAYETYLMKTRELVPTQHPPRETLLELLKKRVDGSVWDKKAFQILERFNRETKDKSHAEVEAWIIEHRRTTEHHG